MTYEIQDTIPEIKHKRLRRSKFPFDQLSVGKSFVVTDKKHFDACRSRACEYNKRNNVKIKTALLNDGTLLVYRESLTAESEALRPSKWEFVSYLAAMTLGASFKLGSEYASRFAELTEWCNEYSRETEHTVNAAVIDSVLVVTRSE